MGTAKTTTKSRKTTALTIGEEDAPSRNQRFDPPPLLIPDSLNLVQEIKGLGRVQITLSSIGWLEEAPGIRELAQRKGSEAIETHLWFCFMTVEGAGDSRMSGVVYFAPPYSDIRIGLGILLSAWSEWVTDKAVDSLLLPLAWLTRATFQVTQDARILKALGRVA